MMDKRLDRNIFNERKKSSSLQKKLADRRLTENVAPDLTDFMNDMFFGTVEKKAYNLTGGFLNEHEGFGDSTSSKNNNNTHNSSGSGSSRLTQEWLDEAKRKVAISPSRCSSPQSRLGVSPRFADTGVLRMRVAEIPGSLGDRRDPLSRSARRHRGAESISGKILIKSAKHNRSKSELFDNHADTSHDSSVNKWFSDILKPHNNNPPKPVEEPNPTVSPLPPSSPRKPRFQTPPQGIPTRFSRRTFRTNSLTDEGTTGSPTREAQLLSPPRNLVESANRRSISSSTCSFQENRKLSSTTSLTDNSVSRIVENVPCVQEKAEHGGNNSLNGFLKEQRFKIRQILSREINRKAKIVLSGPSNSTSSMVAAICYAWLLENKTRNKRSSEGNELVVVPVMNMRRGKMLKQRQVAWLLHHVGLDATALLFSDEVDLETLMMSKQLSMLIVGQDVLKTNGEVGSQCTILTDNYCEDAYDILQTPVVRKLMIAGILLDTQNLNMSRKLPMTRDSEAVQLLSVGLTPNYQNTLYNQLTHDQPDSSLLVALLKDYGKSPNIVSGHKNGTKLEHKHEGTKVGNEKVTAKQDKICKETSIVNNHSAPQKSATPKSGPVKAASPASSGKDDRGKNGFFLAKWFGFGK